MKIKIGKAFKGVVKGVGNVVKGIEKDPLKAAMIAGAAVLTGGAAAALGASTLTAGLAGAGVAAAGARSVEQDYVQGKKAEKAQDAYNQAVAEENARASTARRASLLSMRRQYTRKTGTSGQGGGGSTEDKTDFTLG